MNNKIILLAVNLKSLLAKEDMNIDTAKLLNEKPYAISTLKKALTSENAKTVETANSIIAELGLNMGGGSAAPPPTSSTSGSKPQTEAERIQAMKDKYKKDNGRS